MKRFLFIYTLVALAVVASWNLMAPRPRPAPFSQHKACAPLDATLSPAEQLDLRRSLDRSYTDGPVTIMGFRVWRLNASLEGLRRTSQRMVAWDTQLSASECGDDQGIYYFIPAMSEQLGKPPAVVLSRLLFALLVLSTLSASLCLWKVIEHPPLRIYALFLLLAVTALTLRIGDLYVLHTVAVFLIVPAALYLIQAQRSLLTVLLFVSATGTVAALLDFLRGHAGMILLLMVVARIALMAVSRSRRLSLLAGAVGCYLAASLFFSQAVQQRNTYLQAHETAFSGAYGGHAFWHTVYLSLGLVPNQMIGAPIDESSAQAVAAVSQKVTYLSSEYEAILRRLTFELAMQHPEIIAVNLALKSLLIIFLGTMVGNIGWYAAAANPDWRLHLQFWPAFLCHALIGLLAIPHPRYLLGLISMISIYSLLNIDASWRQIRFQPSAILGKETIKAHAASQ